MFLPCFKRIFSRKLTSFVWYGYNIQEYLNTFAACANNKDDMNIEQYKGTVEYLVKILVKLGLGPTNLPHSYTLCAGWVKHEGKSCQLCTSCISRFAEFSMSQCKLFVPCFTVLYWSQITGCSSFATNGSCQEVHFFGLEFCLPKTIAQNHLPLMVMSETIYI